MEKYEKLGAANCIVPGPPTSRVTCRMSYPVYLEDKWQSFVAGMLKELHKAIEGRRRLLGGG